MKALTRKEKILNGDKIAPLTRPEMFTQKAVGGAGGSGLPEYTSADKGKFLGLGEADPVETEVVVVPEQTVTVSQGAQYCYASLADVSIDWSNAKTGDSINLTVNGSKYTANYSANAFGAPAFVAMNGSSPIAAVANTGTDKVYVNTFLTAASGEYTVSATVSVPSVEPKWDNVPSKVVHTIMPQEMETFVMSSIQSHMASAIAAGVGVPTFVIASGSVTDTDGVSTLLDDIATAANRNAIILLGRLTVLEYSTITGQGDMASLMFTYPIYPANGYYFRIDIVAQCNLANYNLNAVITLLSSDK